MSVSAAKFDSAALIDQYEREAVRPHVFGRFEDLVQACEQHPAMLVYLDQARSAGPDSLAGQGRNGGINENLAREMLELHTVGSNAGYSQADVSELAKALTGWSIPRAQDRPNSRQIQPGANGFVFRANIHEPGARTVMGKTYPAAGRRQGEAILRDLARHSATARRLCQRIAEHFVADRPAPELPARLEAARTASGCDLAEVARALIGAPQTWEPAASKVKTPYEFVVSTLRALDQQPSRLRPLRLAMSSMGQPPLSPASPEGWPDQAADWAVPDALVKRLEWARSMAQTAQVSDVDALARSALGPRLSDRTRTAVARSETRSEALTLLLMSPEFQRR